MSTDLDRQVAEALGVEPDTDYAVLDITGKVLAQYPEDEDLARDALCRLEEAATVERVLVYPRFSTDPTLLPQMVEWLDENTLNFKIQSRRRISGDRNCHGTARRGTGYLKFDSNGIPTEYFEFSSYVATDDVEETFQQAVCRLIIEVAKATGK